MGYFTPKIDRIADEGMLFTDSYAADPLGPSFNPGTMRAALHAGTPEFDLLTRAWARTCPQRNVPELLLA